MGRFINLLTIFITGFTLAMVTASLSCKNADGVDVDWFYVYKLPKPTKKSMISDGVTFYYLDDDHPVFNISPTTIAHHRQPISNTLNQIYTRREHVSYFFYNDHFPGELHARGGRTAHAKGVVAHDNDSGFWLIHSVPRFPSNQSYVWPETAKSFGQSMLCVSFPQSEMTKIKRQLEIMSPICYYKRHFDFQNNGRSRPTHNIQELISIKGQRFQHFSKAASFEIDLYEDLVVPELGCNLLVETFLLGNVVKVTSSEAVKNVKTIKLPHSAAFNSSRDHSKWAISHNSAEKRTVCVGDINRTTSQFRRGGGTLCADLPDVWVQYNKTVLEIEEPPCSYQFLRDIVVLIRVTIIGLFV